MPRLRRIRCRPGALPPSRVIGRPVFGDEAERFLDGVHGLDGADDDAAEGIAARGPEAAGGRGFAGERGQLAGIERVSSEWAGEVRAASSAACRAVECGTWNSVLWSANSLAGKLWPSLERISPESMAY